MKITFIRLAVILVVAFATMAPAPKGAIQYAGLVTRKLMRLIHRLIPMIFLEIGISSYGTFQP